MELTKEVFDELYNEFIPHKRYLEIIKTIEAKIGEIWDFIVNETNLKMRFWEFENAYDDENGGSFDPIENKEKISIYSEYTGSMPKGCEYDEGFPTSFLWQDYKTIIRQHIAEIKQKEIEQKEKNKLVSQAKKEQKEVLINSIKSKLTEDELKLISFK